MPQISQISEILASQLFWLIVTFGLVYLVIGRGMVPKIEATVEKRDRRIAEDLAEAERARARADEVEEEYRQRMEQSRGEAMKLIQAAREQTALENEQRFAEADARIGARLAEAEERIAAAARSAMGEIEGVAAEAAREMAHKLAGLDVPAEAAETAVKAELADA